MNKRWLLSLLLVALVSVTAACGNGEEAGKDTNKEAETQQEESAENKKSEKTSKQPEMPKPDFEGVPKVVAVVNGEDIPRKEFEDVYTGQFQQAALQSQMSGQEVNQEQLRKQVVDGMVNQELLTQEANSGNYTASEEEVNQFLDKVVKQNGLESKEKLMKMLEKQGMDKEEVMSQVKTQVKVDQLIESKHGEVKVTEQELKKAYEQTKKMQSQMGGGEKAKMPSFEEMKPKLKEQVEGQKKAEATQSIVKKLREDAEVKINL
ncbi:SurA N-terminal domain-containing protein [Bacillus tianshenii]|nr:SurA N-terminal domain-containing protein [Bacillus tianshenii]